MIIARAATPPAAPPAMAPTGGELGVGKGVAAGCAIGGIPLVEVEVAAADEVVTEVEVGAEDEVADVVLARNGAATLGFEERNPAVKSPGAHPLLAHGFDLQQPRNGGVVPVQVYHRLPVGHD